MIGCGLGPSFLALRRRGAVAPPEVGIWQRALFSRNAAVNNVTGNGTYYPLQFDTTLTGQSWASLNTGTGAITVSDAGGYIIRAYSSVRDASPVMDDHRLRVKVNGVVHAIARFLADGTSYETQVAVALVELAANDVVTVEIYVNGVGADSCDLDADGSHVELWKVSDLSGQLGQVMEVRNGSDYAMATGFQTAPLDTVVKSSPLGTLAGNAVTIQQSGLYLVVNYSLYQGGGTYFPRVVTKILATGQQNRYAGSGVVDNTNNHHGNTIDLMYLNAGDTIQHYPYTSDIGTGLLLKSNSFYTKIQIMRIGSLPEFQHFGLAANLDDFSGDNTTKLLPFDEEYQTRPSWITSFSGGRATVTSGKYIMAGGLYAHGATGIDLHATSFYKNGVKTVAMDGETHYFGIGQTRYDHHGMSINTAADGDIFDMRVRNSGPGGNFVDFDGNGSVAWWIIAKLAD